MYCVPPVCEGWSYNHGTKKYQYPRSEELRALLPGILPWPPRPAAAHSMDIVAGFGMALSRSALSRKGAFALRMNAKSQACSGSVELATGLLKSPEMSTELASQRADVSVGHKLRTPFL